MIYDNISLQRYITKTLATAFLFVWFAVCIYLLLELWEVFKGLNQNNSDEQNNG